MIDLDAVFEGSLLQDWYQVTVQLGSLLANMTSSEQITDCGHSRSYGRLAAIQRLLVIYVESYPPFRAVNGARVRSHSFI